MATTPTVTAQTVTAITTTTATLNGTITVAGTGGAATVEGFNYGLTTGYGSTASASFAASIGFVQSANSGAPSGTATSKTANFASAQSLGNINIVAISFGNAGSAVTQTVTSVVDTKGNVYVPATTLTTFQDSSLDGDSLIVYYAPNIGASLAAANTVTVTVSAAVSFFIISVLEYTGIVTASPVDVTSSGHANGLDPATINATSGSATTLNASDLLLGAFVFFDGPAAVGAGFTSRVSVYTMLIEELILTSAGPNTAIATSTGTSGWAAQLIAFTGGSFGTGTFTQNITGLTPGTTYHVQAFATNPSGNGTASDLTFTTTALPVATAGGPSFNSTLSNAATMVESISKNAASMDSHIPEGLRRIYDSVQTQITKIFRV